MLFRYIRILSVIILALGFLFKADLFGADKLTVAVSIAPQEYFLTKIGGNRVSPLTLVPPGTNPHTFEPRIGKLRLLAKAKAYFTIGIEFEKAWLPRFKAVNPKMLILDSAKGIKRIHIVSNKKIETGDVDPHVWLSPKEALVIAGNFFNGMIEIDPEGKAIYRKGYENLISEIIQLNDRIKELFLHCTKKEFLVFHPAWGYFARDYGLRQIPIEIEGKELAPKELIHLILQVKKRGINTVFVEPQISSRTVKMLAKDMGLKVVVADPMAKNWADNLLQVARKLEKALE